MKGSVLSQPFRCLILLPLALLVLWSAAVAAATLPETGSPLHIGARQEKDLVIYAAIDRTVGDLLVNDFSSRYPGIKVFLVAMTGAEVFAAHMQDLGKRRRAADLLWSSDSELQAALVSGGYAATYRAAGSGEIFPWANRHDTVYATAHEPVAMVYHRGLLAGSEIPASHAELLRVVGEERFRGKIATVDPEKNGRAFGFLTHDQASGVRFRNLVQGFGRAGLKLCPDYATLLNSVASGEAVFGYNVPAREALRRAKADPAVGVLYFGDYTLSTPLTILMAKDAPHPNAARLWIEYILSARGQEILTRGLDLFPVRGDVAGGEMSREPLTLPSGRGLKIMMPDRELARFTEKGIRRGFVVRWQEMLKTAK